MSWLTMWQRWLLRAFQWLGMPAFVALDEAGSLAPPPPPRVAARVATAPPGDHACAVCATVLPLGTARTHDGHWRCVAHKAVTCDACGRTLPAVTLADQAWTCGSH